MVVVLLTALALLHLHTGAGSPPFSPALECQPLSAADTRFIPIFHPLPELRPLPAHGPHAGLLWTNQGNHPGSTFRGKDRFSVELR